MKLSRRSCLWGGAGALSGLGATQICSLLGHWDHSRRLSHALGSCDLPQSPPRSGVLHVAHSTHVLRVDDVQVVTDPWLHDPAFGSLVHPSAPACDVDTLAASAAVVISHRHPDHCDLRALDRWPSKQSTQVLVGDARLVSVLRKLGFVRVYKLNDWASYGLGPIQIHAVPALHDVPEQGFVLEGASQCVYFAGDTAVHDFFPALAERYRPTLAMLPIDGGRLRGSALHTLTPSEAVSAAGQLGVDAVCPTHADAVFDDWLAEYVLSDHVRGALSSFEQEIRARLPALTLHAPAPGRWVAL